MFHGLVNTVMPYRLRPDHIQHGTVTAMTVPDGSVLECTVDKAQNAV